MDSDFKNESSASDYLKRVNFIVIRPFDHPEFTRMHRNYKDRDAPDHNPSSSSQICFPRTGFYTDFPFHRTIFGASYLLRFSTVLRRSFSDILPTFPTSLYTFPHPLSYFVPAASTRRKLSELDFGKFMKFFSEPSSSVSFSFPSSLYINTPTCISHTHTNTHTHTHTQFHSPTHLHHSRFTHTLTTMAP